MFFHADSMTLNAQADRSLHWAHMSFCWFCHAQLKCAGRQQRWSFVFVTKINIIKVNDPIFIIDLQTYRLSTSKDLF